MVGTNQNLSNYGLVNVNGCNVSMFAQVYFMNAKYRFAKGPTNQQSGQYEYYLLDKNSNAFHINGIIGSHIHNTGDCDIVVFGD